MKDKVEIHEKVMSDEVVRSGGDPKPLLWRTNRSKMQQEDRTARAPITQQIQYFCKCSLRRICLPCWMCIVWHILKSICVWGAKNTHFCCWLRQQLCTNLIPHKAKMQTCFATRGFLFFFFFLPTLLLIIRKNGMQIFVNFCVCVSVHLYNN